LDPPPHGLHLRRVQWQAFSTNQASIAAAQRLGFQLEGIIRWQRVLPEGKIGNSDGVIDDKMPEMDPTGQKRLGPGRHSAMLSLCWDDWENGARERLHALSQKYA
jgi:RimJ/RimL family protein N-acetyltransferase